MKNIIKVTLSIIFFTTAYFNTKAQSNVGAVNESRLVIATSGLNLRSAPTLKSSIVKLVSYGREVQLVERKEFAKADTLLIGGGRALTGSWLKVSYRGYKGYMFSPFLARIEGPNFPTELVDNDFALLMEGKNCNYNFQYRRDFNYTGIYKTVSGKYRAKKVNVTYTSDRADGRECYSVDTDEVEKILFIIGTRNTPITVNDGYFSYFQKLNNQKGRAMDQVFYNEETGGIDYCHDNISYDLSDRNYKAMSLVWRGDLDADGIDDFIVQYGEEDGKIVLHLSTQTAEGELHKAVAEYYLG